MKLALIIVGIILIIEGAPWFLSPSGVRRALLELSKSGETGLRIIGFACMLTGLLVVYAAVYHVS